MSLEPILDVSESLISTESGTTTLGGGLASLRAFVAANSTRSCWLLFLMLRVIEGHHGLCDLVIASVAGQRFGFESTTSSVSVLFRWCI